MSRVEAFGDSKPRSLLRELRTDIAMAVDDSFPLVYGLADKNIITDQLLKVSDYIWKMSAVFLLLPNFHQYIKIGFWDKYCFFELLKCLIRMKLALAGMYCSVRTAAFSNFNRTLWRKKAEKESTGPSTRSCPGSWSREDPPSRSSGATCLKTTTRTATPSSRHCSATCSPVRYSPL